MSGRTGDFEWNEYLAQPEDRYYGDYTESNLQLDRLPDQQLPFVEPFIYRQHPDAEGRM